jgi:hypothetical protein
MKVSAFLGQPNIKINIKLQITNPNPAKAVYNYPRKQLKLNGASKIINSKQF